KPKGDRTVESQVSRRRCGLPLSWGGDKKSKSPPCRGKRDKSGAPSRVEIRKGWASPHFSHLRDALALSAQQNPKGDGTVESHLSKDTKRWGTRPPST